MHWYNCDGLNVEYIPDDRELNIWTASYGEPTSDTITLRTLEDMRQLRDVLDAAIRDIVIRNGDNC